MSKIIGGLSAARITIAEEAKLEEKAENVEEGDASAVSGDEKKTAVDDVVIVVDGGEVEEKKEDRNEGGEGCHSDTTPSQDNQI